jgi:hypothetical protein
VFTSLFQVKIIIVIIALSNAKFFFFAFVISQCYRVWNQQETVNAECHLCCQLVIHFFFWSPLLVRLIFISMFFFFFLLISRNITTFPHLKLQKKIENHSIYIFSIICFITIFICLPFWYEWKIMLNFSLSVHTLM